MQKIFETITGLKKTASKKEAERKELADVVEQGNLIEMKGQWAISTGDLKMTI